MNCIDFDARFAAYTAQWVKENASRYKNADEMEADFPEVYIKWLNTPAQWLDGTSPAQYFAAYDDAGQLVAWMQQYYDEGVSVPEVLLERITQLGKPAEAALTALFDLGEDQREAKLAAVGLLEQMQSEAAFDRYIVMIASAEEKDDLAECAADAMAGCAADYKERLLAAYGNATAAGKVRLIDILAYMRGDERIFNLLMDAFERGGDKALYASYILRYGDERALPKLMEALNDPEIGYLDYIEVRNAAEALGATILDTRDFTGDRDYEALKGM